MSRRSSTRSPARPPARTRRRQPRVRPASGRTIVGSVVMLDEVPFERLGTPRPIAVYLPRSYEQGARRYPVLYMQDGQNLFDEETAFSGEWRVDETLERLSAIGIEAIAVAIGNAGEDRLREYSPFVDPVHGGGDGARYLEFVVRDLKPLVDAQFRTRPDVESCGLFGSSMGALVSLYGFFAYPEVFGFTGIMSPALWFGGREIFPFVSAARRTAGRLYLDVGTAEGDEALADARRMHAALLDKGYVRGRDLLFVEEEGADHSEAAWGRRLHTALYFLLPGAQAG